MVRKEKQENTFQRLIFKTMSNWTSYNWMHSRYKAYFQTLKTTENLKSLSKIEQLEFMRKQSKQADLLIEDFKKTRTNG